MNSVLPEKPASLGAAVGPLLRDKGWTGAELARRAEMPHPVLSRLLTGVRPPSFEQLSRIARALEVSVLKLAHEAGLSNILDDLIPRAYFDVLDAQRAEAQRRSSVLAAELAAKTTETEHYRQALASRELQVRDLQRQLAQQNQVALRAEVQHLMERLVESEVARVGMHASLESQEAKISELQKLNAELRHVAQALQSRIFVIEARAASIAHEIKSGGTTNAVSILGAIASLGAGAWVSGMHDVSTPNIRLQVKVKK